MKTQTQAEPEVVKISKELRKVQAFRALGLLDLGFTYEQAGQLMGRVDVVHDAARLLERGCPHTYVVKELT